MKPTVKYWGGRFCHSTGCNGKRKWGRCGGWCRKRLRWELQTSPKYPAAHMQLSRARVGEVNIPALLFLKSASPGGASNWWDSTGNLRTNEIVDAAHPAQPLRAESCGERNREEDLPGKEDNQPMRCCCTWNLKVRGPFLSSPGKVEAKGHPNCQNSVDLPFILYGLFDEEEVKGWKRIVENDIKMFSKFSTSFFPFFPDIRGDFSPHH